MPTVAIVGAGLSGLSCALRLADAGVEPTVYEAGDAVGGRVRTDLVDGFRLDRGFQVLLTAYPEARRLLDYEALDLHAFESGARVWLGDGFARVADPLRQPAAALESALAPIGSLADKLRVLRLRRSVLAGSVDDLWNRVETRAIDALRVRYGFSERMIDVFWRPFLGGVFLDLDLMASSRAMEFYMRMFSSGTASLPREGMQAIPEQMAARLPAGTVRLGARAVHAAGGALRISGGDEVRADAVVVATEGPEAAALTGVGEADGKGTTALYWAADAPPTDAPTLLLDGTGRGPASNVQVLTNVVPEYAPGGQALISASVVADAGASDAALERDVRRQLTEWFSPETEAWRFLQASRVPYALPALRSLEPPERPLRAADGLYVAGDHRRNASINGAMLAGRHAADAVLADLGVR